MELIWLADEIRSLDQLVQLKETFESLGFSIKLFSDSIEFLPHDTIPTQLCQYVSLDAPSNVKSGPSHLSLQGEFLLPQFCYLVSYNYLKEIDISSFEQKCLHVL